MTHLGGQQPAQITIVGLGAMGTLLAVKLAVAGYKVVGVVRTRAQASAIARLGLRLTVAGGDRLAIHPAGVWAIDDVGAQSNRHSDLIIVAVKSYSTAAVAPAILRMLMPATLVVTMQNGLGNPETLVAAGVPPARLVVGVTTDGATATSPGDSEQRGQGATMLGPYRGPSAHATLGERRPGPSTEQYALLQAFAGAGLAAEWHDDIAPYVWTKLAVNAAINPITALLGVHNGDLLDMPDVLGIMRAAVLEVATVAGAQGVQLSTERIWSAVQSVLASTAANRSSMLQDRLAGRPTEIDAISGAISAQGTRLGISTPVNRCLHALVAAMGSPIWGPTDPQSRSSG